MDLLLLGLCLAATCYGIVLIASATVGPTGGDWSNVIVQSAAMVIGVAMYVAFSVIDIEHFAEKWWLFFLFDVLPKQFNFPVSSRKDFSNSGLFFNIRNPHFLATIVFLI